jgi:hypothetical protein
MQVRVVWLVDASLGGEATQAVPDDLQAAIANLSKKMGMGELRMAAQFVINAGAANPGVFQATGTALLDEPCDLEFEGALSGQPSRLEVSVSSRRNDKTLCPSIPSRPCLSLS